jgi:hypothetical protein
MTPCFYIDAALADDSLNDSLSMRDGSADVSGTSHKDELADVLSPNFNLESMVSQTGRLEMNNKYRGGAATYLTNGLMKDKAAALEYMAARFFSHSFGGHSINSKYFKQIVLLAI